MQLTIQVPEPHASRLAQLASLTGQTASTMATNALVAHLDKLLIGVGRFEKQLAAEDAQDNGARTTTVVLGRKAEPESEPRQQLKQTATGSTRGHLKEPRETSRTVQCEKCNGWVSPKKYEGHIKYCDGRLKPQLKFRTLAPDESDREQAEFDEEESAHRATAPPWIKRSGYRWVSLKEASRRLGYGFSHRTLILLIKSGSLYAERVEIKNLSGHLPWYIKLTDLDVHRLREVCKTRKHLKAEHRVCPICGDEMTGYDITEHMKSCLIVERETRPEVKP